jgi:hypothetical protein
LALAIPMAIVAPLVTLILSTAVTWTAMLFEIAQYLLYALLSTIACVILALASEQGLRAYWKWRTKKLNK